MGAVSVTKQTLVTVQELLPLWQQLTKTEDTRTLVARSVVDCLLDLKNYTDEYEKLDIASKTAA